MQGWLLLKLPNHHLAELIQLSMKLQMNIYYRQGSLCVRFVQYVLFVCVQHFSRTRLPTELSVLNKQVTCLLATLRRLADIPILRSLVSAAGWCVKARL